jgi:hypothetical protein
MAELHGSYIRIPPDVRPDSVILLQNDRTRQHESLAKIGDRSWPKQALPSRRLILQNGAKLVSASPSFVRLLESPGSDAKQLLRPA